MAVVMATSFGVKEDENRCLQQWPATKPSRRRASDVADLQASRYVQTVGRAEKSNQGLNLIQLAILTAKSLESVEG